MATNNAKPQASKAAPKKQLTLEQQKKMLLTPCRTEKELKNFIKYYLNLDLPDTKVSRYADCDPFHAVWQIYDICVNKRNPNNIKELLYVAGRGSGKTLGIAIAELLVLLHDARDVVHVGAILTQAKRCYEYQSRFLLSDKIKNVVMPPKVPEDQRILEKHNMEKSLFNVGIEKLSLEVLPCTLKSVNGPHVPLVCVDEIDTVSGEGLKAFKDIGGMLDSKGGKIALRVGISTRKTRYGLMNQQIENADKEGRTVQRWTAFEFTERCRDDRSGTDPVELYVQQEKLEVITPEEFSKKDATKQKEYFVNKFPGSGCATCPIAAICLGDAKNQTSKSNMLKPLEDLIKKTIENGPDWALSQLMNLKPSVEGIVYKEFEEGLHLKSWNQMWKILTDKEYPGECTHDMFVKKCNEMKLSCYGGIDWGWSNPSTVVYFYVDNRENVYVVRCDGRTHYSNPNWIHHIKHKYHNMYRCQLYFPDLANPGDGEEMRKAGLPCPSKVEKDNASGIQVVKKWLKSLASPVPKIFFATETCQPLKTEFSLYHYKTDAAGQITDTIEDENDHYLDALRYPMYGLFGKSQAVMTYGLDMTDTFGALNPDGKFSRVPSAAEFAASKGIPLNTEKEQDLSKLGKIGTLSELQDEEEDTTQGGGSFLWSI